jgi:ankyrin repeat protein
LFEAAGSGEIALVRLLLQQGNDPNTINLKQVSALANAIFHKRSNVAELLLRHGARHDIIDSTGKSSAVYAAANGETEVLEQILALSADDRSSIDFRYAHELTLLMWAAGYGNTETVAMLIDHGADPTLVDDRGKTALIMAAEKKHLDVVARLQASGSE